MKFALHTSTAISSVLKEPEHFYVDLLSDHFNHRRFYPASVIFFALSPL